MVQYCCCYGCKEKYVKGGSVSFHSFPRDEERAKIWLQKINRENFVHSRHSKVCSKHFTEECFDREKFGGIWLKNDAVPTVFDFPKHPPKLGGQKRPAKRSSSVSPYAVKGSSQNQNELLRSILCRNVLILPAPCTSANGKGNYRIWWISLLQPLPSKGEQTRPDNERNRNATTVVGDPENVQNDSAINKMEWRVATKNKSSQLHCGEKRDSLLRGAVKQKQECEHPFVKKEPVEYHDESTCSAIEENYEYSLVKEEPREDRDRSAFSATEEECEFTFVKEEPIEDPDEFTCSATEEECEFTFVKEEPIEDPNKFTCSATEEECEFTLVKHEPADDPMVPTSPAAEEEHEYIQVKCEAEGSSDTVATHWLSHCFC